jgi:4-amino-4-deoxy-L-arabinose transferase-like glycosyltransferase
MKLFKLMDLVKKPAFVLSLILIAFFLKGVFFAVLYPMFGGQDEARHYNTVQFMAEPKVKDWPKKEKNDRKSGDRTTYNFSEEIANATNETEYYRINSGLYGIQDFQNGYDGKNESEINSETWSRLNQNYPPDIAGSANTRLYQEAASFVEKIFGSQNILVRFYTVRIFSVLLGTLMILLLYLIVKNAGFSSKNSLLISAIISFQPKLASYYSNINYDTLLILLFTLFVLGGILSLKHGLNWKNLPLMMLAIILGMYTKGTAIVLLAVFVFLLIFLLYKKIKEKVWNRKYVLGSIIFGGIAILVLMFFVLKNNFGFSAFNITGDGSGISAITNSLEKYLSKSITMGRFGLSSRTYWGILSWKDNWVSGHLTDYIWIIESISAFGIAMILFSKEKPEYLPEKKYVWFFVGMIAALQFGIRFFDWRIFQKTGSLDLGTPGRYFLPNIAAHCILVFTGLGMLLKKKEYLERLLIASLILMIAFSMYTIFNVVLPRFYL